MVMDPISRWIMLWTNFIMSLIHPSSITQQLVHLIIDFVSYTSYLGIFLLMAAESAVIPIPSEIVMPFSGYLVYTGNLDIWLVTLVATLANLVGSWIAYFVGLKLGRAWILKYGRYVLLRESHLEHAERWFEKYGDKAVFLSRLTPAVRTVISLPAGIAKMDLKKFSLYTFVGSIPWNFALTYLGCLLGQNWSIVESYFKYVDIILVVAIVVIIAFYLIRRHRKKISQQISKA